MSWIKLQTSLPKSAKLAVLADALECCEREALGVAMEWFCWLDEQCTDACTGLTGALLDRVMKCPGLCEALEACGWVQRDEQGMVFVVDFDQHNGEGAKKRAMDARRQAKQRTKGVTHVSEKRHASSVTENGQNTEKRHASSVTENGQNTEMRHASSVTENNAPKPTYDTEVLYTERLTQEEEEDINKSVTHVSEKRHASSVTKNGQVRDLEKEYNSIDKGGRLSDAILVRDAEPAHTQAEDGFGRWLSAVAGAHPSAKLSRSLAADVAEAARDAYKRCPSAEQEAELLGVYLASRHTLDRHGLAFYKPTGQRRFFMDLEDVIAHAKRWAREFSWKSKNAPKNAPKGGGVVASTPSAQKRAEGGKERQPEGMATDEQDESFWSALRNGEKWDG